MGLSPELSEILKNVSYLVASLLFIFGIKGLAHPRTAVRGNLLGFLGMLLAIVATLFFEGILDWKWIIAGLAVGTVIGAIVAVKIQMTAMPQLVALYNGFGGIASVLVAGAAMHELLSAGEVVTRQVSVAIAASGIIGAVTFSGSALAFAKLQEKLVIGSFQVFKISGRPNTNPLIKLVNVAGTLAALFLSYMVVINPDVAWFYWLLVAVALVVGLFLVLPIGGADMPVVICLLNSYSGLAAAATGFVIHNNVLIIAGSLVGASGLILTRIMCVAMNRSLTNVLFGVMAEAGESLSADEVYAGKVKSAGPDEVAMLFDGARRVLIVPGYGMAVAQAQHVVRDLANVLESRGVRVEFGIHPVAGRMPGHMNVLLAEADVPYDQLKEMDDVNSTMEQVDVALVIGANDVVNPDARENPESPIAGMPIINVDKAKTVVVIKRSLSPGFAGIPNPLFAAENTLMLFGDGKKMVLELVGCVKEA